MVNGRGVGYALRCLVADLRRLRVYCGSSRVFLFALLDMGTIVLIFYRLVRGWRTSNIDLPLLRGLLERLFEMFSKIHFPSGVQAGPGLLVIHGHGLVLNGQTIIGTNVTIYHRVTIGVRYPGDGCAMIGDDSIIGSGAGIFGPVNLPAGTRVRANSVITPKGISRL